MKVFVQMPHLGGVEYHRLYAPLRQLAEDNQLGGGDMDVRVVEQFLPEHIEACDVLIFNRTLGPMTAKILKAMRKLRKPVICDVDDFWELPSKHVSARHYYNNNITGQIRDAVKHSWAVTCTNGVLADQVRKLNSNVHILPNAIDLTAEQWNKPHTGKQQRIRFGWVGGLTHLDDTALLFEPIRHLLQEYPEQVQIVVCGYQEGEHEDSPERQIWQGMISNLMGGGYAKGEQIVVAPGVPATEYGEFYTHFDVALAPLEGGLFNRCKSDLKILEAAAYGLPVIASATHPYSSHAKNDGVLLAHDAEDWFEHMALFVEHPELISIYGMDNHVYCQQHRDFVAINLKRYNLIKRAYKLHTATPHRVSEGNP